MSEKKWTWDEILDAEEVADTHTGQWRWGENRQLVFRHEGKTYAVDYRMQPEYSIQDVSGDPEPYEVEKRERTVVEWVRKRGDHG